jgi:mitogen-activated protein kinase kinase
MADDSRERSIPDPSSNVGDLNSEASTPDSVIPPPQETSPKPPTLRTSYDAAATPLSSSSSPLGAVNAARRPGPPPSRASGLTSDIQAKMKAFSLSRQGAPAHNMRPGVPGQQSALSGGAQPGGFPTSPITGGRPGQSGLSAAPGVPITGLRLPPGMNRPNASNWNSVPSPTPGSPRMMSPRPGGLAAKRGLKPGGMKLSDATKPVDSSEQSQNIPDSGSQFRKYSDIIDTQKGTLNFKNKAVIHGGGIDFSTGSSFSISLDEVDTLDELGKGNYGTVFKVRHARPKMRRPGLGLRGNMQRLSSSSVTSTSPDDYIPSAVAGGTTGLIMAMKEIRLELDDAKFAAIIMELDILHRCISPFIISFYGAFFQEGSVYICMENMDGGSIDKLYGDGVPEGVLRKITLSTVMGLKYLKDEHNIIHRDVKPTNILVNTKGQVKICDFGVSGNLVASIAKTNIGCQSYMAPERISGGGIAQAGAGGGTYSVQSDIWSLALTIIECALGRYPYPPETYNNIFSQLSVS